jgi:uncharacterized membrane protein
MLAVVIFVCVTLIAFNAFYTADEIEERIKNIEPTKESNKIQK